MASEMDYFKSICKVSRAFANNFKKKEILNLIIDTALQVLKGKAACLFLDDKEQALFLPVAQRGLSPDYLHAAPQKARELVHKDLLSDGYISIYDAATDERIENHAAKKEEGIASILVVPVMVHDSPIGVLTLYTGDRRKFTENEIAFLTALAEQGGIAIDRARLIEHIRRNSRLFHDLSAGINASLDFKQIITTLTVDLGHSFKAKGVSVMLLDEDHKTLKPVAVHGIDDSLLSKEALAKDKTITQTLKGETVLIPDAAKDNGVFNPEAHQKENIVTILSVPIKSGQSVNGVLRLYFAAPKDFYKDEIMLINAFALQAGLAIQNTACFLSLENDYKDLKDDMWSHRSWF
ncbi:MAG: GAF domain-containing protein [Desulfobacteraceae bacterium]|nr:GAF domain-containing protein [Desulfobacteraceae bacterium]MBC2754759.1 GAF domain-containing protein [Desulfobacteraceae bacterium]